MIDRRMQNQRPVLNSLTFMRNTEWLSILNDQKQTKFLNMLSTLFIKNFALIDNQEIHFHPGHNVITGETGAGKSIIIGALQIVLGGRADKSLIRKGANECEIGGIFQVDLLPNLSQLLGEYGISECDNNQLIIVRRLKVESVHNFINSTPVTVKIINQISSFIIDIHGAYDHQLLFKASKQLELLNEYSGLKDELAKYETEYNNFCAAKDRVKAFNQRDISIEHIDFITMQLAKIRDANLNVDEDCKLRERHKLVANNSYLLENLNKCTMSLNAENGVISGLSDIRHNIQRLEILEIDAVVNLCKLLESIIVDVQNFEDELRQFEKNIEVDPNELLMVEDRLTLVENLKRRYGGNLQSVLEHAEKMEMEISEFENYESRLNTLVNNVDTLKEKALKSALALSNRRKKHAKKLAKEVVDKLKKLGFKHAKFDINFSKDSLSVDGVDSIEFYISPNQGEDLKPLRNIASSGEISRIMLAIKTILAHSDRIPILVFDEIDVNIGGTTASAVGREMKHLGESRQIICITHLPQVAAVSDQHFAVEKFVKKSRTHTRLITLSDDQRVKELCRMLGGEEKDKVVCDHAKQLLNG